MSRQRGLVPRREKEKDGLLLKCWKRRVAGWAEPASFQWGWGGVGSPQGGGTSLAATSPWSAGEAFVFWVSSCYQPPAQHSGGAPAHISIP